MKRVIAVCSLLALAACVPPPPPPPPAMQTTESTMMAPAGGRIFTVYFGWNRSWVGPAGMAVLQQAAAVYRMGGVVTVQVTGFTDTSGSVPYNQRLSERRAGHVAQILSRMGVPWNVMAISGHGENDLALPTPDGVREPRNRRVTVVE
ncbi:MAG: OmpA family protein [Alphaproteobacteria bacterium]|nr:OmpA family protein [Alphaproteobacteria bacterium]